MSETRFDPTRHLRKVRGGAEYLEVKWRLVWFRERFPNGRIETELLHFTGSSGVVKATVTAIDADGAIHGLATGIKAGDAASFGDFLEKAETGAIGRALAALGFGTQFTADEYGEGEDRVVDAPVQRDSGARRERPANWGSPQPPTELRPETNRVAQTSSSMATEAQVKAIYGISKGLGWEPDTLFQWLSNVRPEELSKQEASSVIKDLNQFKSEQVSTAGGGR